jgi:phage terminase large subunit GpA-like protein
MECPKCGGGTYLAEEELVKVLENTDPVKIIAKATFVCRACSERFSRLICDTLEARNKSDVIGTATTPIEQRSSESSDSEHVEGLKFF